MRLSRLIVCCLLGVLSWAQAWAEESVTNEWVADIGSHADSSPAVAEDGIIYLGTWLGQLWALNPDGTRKWVFQAGNEIRSSPAVGADGTVYFGSRDRKFYAVGADGKEKWEFRTGAWVDSSAALGSDGTVYFGSWDKNFYALRPEGSKKWQFQTGGAIVSSPAIGEGGRIYGGSHDGKLYCWLPAGTKAWEFETGGPILSSPAIGADGAVYFTSLDGYCYALEAGGGLRWRLQTGGITGSSPVIGADGTLYVGGNVGLWAISPQGKKKWDHGGGYPIEVTPLVAADHSVCYTSWYGLLTDLTPDQQVNWTFYLCNNHGHASPALSASGRVYVPDCSHEFHALGTKLHLAHTAWPKFRGDPRNTGNRGGLTPDGPGK